MRQQSVELAFPAAAAHLPCIRAQPFVFAWSNAWLAGASLGDPPTQVSSSVLFTVLAILLAGGVAVLLGNSSRP